MKKSILLLFIIVMALSGCKDVRTEDAVKQGDVYNIYTVLGNRIVSEEYRTGTKDGELLVAELLEKLNLTKSSEEGAIQVEAGSINSRVLYLSFNSYYKMMDSITEVLFRASVVKTITQIQDISYVYFYVDGKSLAYADGTTVGKMAASDFVDETNGDLNSLAWTTITLYFSNSTGDKLLRKDINTAYSKTMSIERLIVEQLIAGPDKEDEGMKATQPANLRVISVSVKDGICYVNLDGVFTSEIVDVSANVQIYSIVNSLTELSSVSGVQLQVNGASNYALRDISLEKAFARNPDIIEAKEEEEN